MKFMTLLLSELETATKSHEVEDVTDSAAADMQNFFTVEELPNSFDAFIKHEKDKIVNHRQLFPVKQVRRHIFIYDLINLPQE